MSPYIKDHSPSWLEETPTQDSPQFQKKNQPECSPNLQERDDGHQIPSTNLHGDDLPTSLSWDEQVESSEDPVLEGATLDTEPRRSSRIRQTPARYTSDFCPASKWVGDKEMAMFSAIEDSYFYDEEWDEIMTLLA